MIHRPASVSLLHFRFWIFDFRLGTLDFGLLHLTNVEERDTSEEWLICCLLEPGITHQPDERLTAWEVRGGAVQVIISLAMTAEQSTQEGTDPAGIKSVERTEKSCRLP